MLCFYLNFVGQRNHDQFETWYIKNTNFLLYNDGNFKIIHVKVICNSMLSINIKQNLIIGLTAKDDVISNHISSLCLQNLLGDVT